MIYRTFISHAWAYNQTYWAIRRMLDRAQDEYHDFAWIDYSIPSHNPLINRRGAILVGQRSLAEKIKSKIRQSSVVLIPARMFINNSYWVRAEIRYARGHRKRIIAVKSRETKRVPIELAMVADDTVDANYRSLRNAIAGPFNYLR